MLETEVREKIEPTVNLAPVVVSELTAWDLTMNLASRFNKAILIEMCMGEYLMAVNGDEAGRSDDFVRAANQTVSLIRRNTYSAFMDIFDYGSTELLIQTVNVLKACRQYRNYEIPSIEIGGNPSMALEAISKRVIELQSHEYQDKYMDR